jgi:hypothetical protein
MNTDLCPTEEQETQWEAQREEDAGTRLYFARKNMGWF